MSVLALEGWVEGGQIRLKSPNELPERQRVIVVVPDSASAQARIASPRMADPTHAALFDLEVVELEEYRPQSEAESGVMGVKSRRQQLDEVLTHQGQIDLQLDQETLQRLRQGS